MRRNDVLLWHRSITPRVASYNNTNSLALPRSIDNRFVQRQLSPVHNPLSAGAHFGCFLLDMRRFCGMG